MVKNIKRTGKIRQLVEVQKYNIHMPWQCTFFTKRNREMPVHCIVREHQDSVTYELQAQIKVVIRYQLGRPKLELLVT